jgi:sulfur carrier protein
MIEIVLNGEKRSVPAGANVLQLLHFLELAPDKVAVEVNREIVRQPEWKNQEISPGSEVEIVQFVGGG